PLRAIVEFRAEFFNVFNHTKFFTRETQTITTTTFGQVSDTFNPRIGFAQKVLILGFLCATSVSSVSLWCGFTRNSSTTETQRTQRLCRESAIETFVQSRTLSKAYAVAPIAFSLVGSLISSLRIGVSTFGAGIVTSSTPLRNVAVASSVFAPSGSGI